jgi:hypothetical protein
MKNDEALAKIIEKYMQCGDWQQWLPLARALIKEQTMPREVLGKYAVNFIRDLICLNANPSDIVREVSGYLATLATVIKVKGEDGARKAYSE